MRDATARRAAAIDAPRAKAALERFERLLPEARGGAILDARGELVAASGEPERWEQAAIALLRAADAAAGERAARVHVATEEGEAYAVREGEVAMVAATDRFALASLVLSDMRAALRAARAGDAANGS